ncbi:hypothetical protein Q5P01_010720 [Channa striata]|uniref:Uncharacterized protein n=1 Tax=Channa striata TaxID=64152 RepID=A0AA88SNG2_CHASR|nr:hypothetical protein Q5P01_010720 [Channa striata]
MFVQVSPLSSPSTRITVSGVPPFIPNELLVNELCGLGCEDPKVKHVQSLRRHAFMFLDSPTQTLEVSFRVKHGDDSYLRFACPHKQQPVKGAAVDTVSGDTATETVAGPAVEAAADPTVGVRDDNDKDVQIKFIEHQDTNVATEELSSSQTEDSIEAVAVTNSQITEVGEDMEYDTESDTLSIEQINDFLNHTSKKSVKVKDYFSDTDKFIRSAGILMKMVGLDLLDERKLFRLKKHVTTLNKLPKGKTAKKIKLSK